MEPSLREKVIVAIAEAHAQALVKHYGDTEAVIGLDPGHGGSDRGSSSNGVNEHELTWKVSNMVAERLFDLSKGKYNIVILRPEVPKDSDLDRDGVVSNIERLQKRKALLLKMEAELRKDKPQDIGEKLLMSRFTSTAQEMGVPLARKFIGLTIRQ